MDEAARDEALSESKVTSAKLEAFNELIKAHDVAELSANFEARRMADLVLYGREPTENNKLVYRAVRDKLDQLNKQITDFWRDHHAGH